MKIFYGGSIQGGRQKSGFGGEMIDYLKSMGVMVATEHVRGKDREETRRILAGELKISDAELTLDVIFESSQDWCEGKLDGAILEMSVPSHGTGMELMMLLQRKDVPILCIYEKDFHPGRLSSMVTGARKRYPQLRVREYSNFLDAKKAVEGFILSIKEGNLKKAEGSPSVGKERES